MRLSLTNLVCILFDPAIPTSFFNLISIPEILVICSIIELSTTCTCTLKATAYFPFWTGQLTCRAQQTPDHNYWASSLSNRYKLAGFTYKG